MRLRSRGARSGPLHAATVWLYLGCLTLDALDLFRVRELRRSLLLSYLRN
jgi:hypothetical protein